MIKFSKELETILKTEIFTRVINSDFAKLAEINALLALLIEADIPFDTAFSPGTRRTAAAIELTIYINPTTTINFVITLEQGGSIFTDT